MMGETEDNVDECFGDVYKFIEETGLNGLPARGDEPATFPIRSWITESAKSAKRGRRLLQQGLVL
jgi:hypothetical protein